MAEESGVPQLMLTHFYPAVEKADPAAAVRTAYDGRVIMARDGLTIEL